MEIIKLRDEFIKLGQALKAAGLVESGVDAKEVIVQGLVVVNGEIETRRGRKLYKYSEIIVVAILQMVKVMYIESIELSNYRNYSNVKVEFGKNTNILYGDNAQGKTNILESIYMAATTKSHRKNTQDKDIIKIGEDESHIRLFVNKKDISHKIDMHLRKSKNKGVAIDGIPIRRATELYGLLNVIFFSPEDLTIIKKDQPRGEGSWILNCVR